MLLVFRLDVDARVFLIHVSDVLFCSTFARLLTQLLPNIRFRERPAHPKPRP